MTPRLALYALVLVGCGPKAIPPHLRVEPTEEQAQASGPVTTLAEAAERLVRTDPLLRRPDPGTLDTWRQVPNSEPIEAWARLARAPTTPPKDWEALEAAHRGTLAVPLARGAGLAAMEAAAASSEPTGSEGRVLLSWLGPVVIEGGPLPSAARGALDWLESNPAQARAAALRWSERAVLLGWLDGPGLPVGPAAASLQPGVYDRLLDSPTGALLRGRASGVQDTALETQAASDLRRATALALMRVSADRDSEQERWRDRRASLVPDLGEDPIGALLASARTGATRAAGSDGATATALVALAAERLHGSCPDEPCEGLDRVSSLAAAERWTADDDELRGLIAVWRVIALKGALDRLEVTRERAGVPGAWGDLGDALVGTGGGSVPEHLLRTRTPSPNTWLALSRAAGGTDATTWEDCWPVLQAKLGALIDDALKNNGLDAEVRELLERQRRRIR